MEHWDLDAIELIGPALIEFGENGEGRFRFIAVEGQMDCRHGFRDGRPFAQFTWEGWDEGDQVSGWGWAVQEEDGSLRGHIFFHLGDDASFRAVHSGKEPSLDRRDAPA